MPVHAVRGGFEPKLEIAYDSGSGNGAFGAGWQLGIPGITRKTDKGLPRYDDYTPTDVFIFAGAEDLVASSDVAYQMREGFQIRSFRPRVEGGFARIEWWFHLDDPAQNHWRVISRENVTHVLGLTPAARIADAADPTRVFQWLLEASFDDKGNSLVHTYRPENLDGVGPDLASEGHRLDGLSDIAGTHVESVVYGNKSPFFPGREGDYLPSIKQLVQSAASFEKSWLFRIVFDYKKREDFADSRTDNSDWSLRADPFSSYRSGFETRNYRLCHRILFESNVSVEEDGLETGYTGITHGLFFNYEPSPILAKLKSIQQIHFRRKDSSAGEVPAYQTAEWPPLEFEYSVAKEMDFKTVPHSSAPSLAEGVDGSRYEWVDLDGEGIPGVISRRGDSWWYSPNRWSSLSTTGIAPPNVPATGGSFRCQQPLRLQPAAGPSVAQLIDLDGDGTLDVVDYSNRATLVYERDDRQGWTGPRVLSRGPAFDMSDPNIRFLDLDGDGKAEILLTEHDCFVWQEGLGGEGFGAVHRVAKILDERRGPRCLFSEVIQTIFLADMSGDGLTDIVRVRNGEVSYWPNIGYGKFGARVTMDGAPVFDHSDQFDSKRLRLLDVDGSGIADIVYLGRDGASYWVNHSGNTWSESRSIPFRIVHSLASVSSADFYGRGTGCLVWSSASHADSGSHFCVVDLTGGVKPHLLTVIRNNLGAETKLNYASSTQFYLKDLADNRPWITKLPFPVHVVASVETNDLISRNRFISRYAYHHGFFDGVEREFRGFGMVEQWDTEQIDTVGNEVIDSENWDACSYVPPAHRKTWFHHGAWREDATLVHAFKAEYWKGDSRELAPGKKGIDLEDTIIPEGLFVDEEREAYRSLRGRMLRQEIFANDDSTKASNPYEVVEQNFTIEVLQRRGKNHHAVFVVHPRETVRAQYERAGAPDGSAAVDPRVTHEMALKVDHFGNVEQSLSIGYKRRDDSPPMLEPEERQMTGEERDIQKRTLLTFTASSFTEPVDAPNARRTPLPSEVRTFEVKQTTWSSAHWVSFDQAFTLLADWNKAPSNPNQPQLRLIEHVLVLYRKDDLKSLLLQGQMESMALPGETLKLALTLPILDLLSDRASTQEITDILLDSNSSGYQGPDADGCFWISSGRTFFSSDASDDAQGAGAELAFARGHFFLPHKFRDPFGNATRVAYDPPLLRLAQITDPLGSITRAMCDYRVLQPKLLADANGNHTAAAFDTRGMLVATAILGKTEPVGEFGDSLEGLSPDLSAADLEEFIKDPIKTAPGLLGNATTRFVYDVMRFAGADDPDTPVFAASLERQFHVKLPFQSGSIENKLAGLENFDLQDHIQCKFSYSDGFGREIQQKVRTAPLIKDGNPPSTTPPRWLGSGWTVFNNKGKPVREYEPFFTATHEFEFDKKVGVSPILFYDPMDRVVARLRPDHSWEKVVFDPWRQTKWDANDTVLRRNANGKMVKNDPHNDCDVGDFFKRLAKSEWSPTWYESRKIAPTDPKDWRGKQEHEAAMKAAEHADTPTDTYFDTLGREFLVVTWNTYVAPRSGTAKTEFARTRTEFDIEGNRLAVVDALGRTVMRWDYDMFSRPLKESSMDAGHRWVLPDAGNQPLRRWDERGHAFRHTYDALRRPSQNFITKPANGAAAPKEICYELLRYGEHRDAPKTGNLRGRLWDHRDTAGLVTMQGYDAKGNLLGSSRQFCDEFVATLDWSVTQNLEEEEFVTSSVFDALNRPIRITTPDGHNGKDGSQTFPRYNLFGQLFATTVHTQKPNFDLQGNEIGGFHWDRFYIVRGIDYNARGQRRIVQYGNNRGGYGLRTTLNYDPKTFRLLSLQTINKDSGAPTNNYQALDYAYDPVGNISSIRDTAQPTHFFNNQVVSPHADYTYDAIYRLLAAKGREHIGQNLPANQPSDAFDSHRLNIPLPGETQAMRNYTQSYAYDVVGNFEAMIHKAQNGDWTRNYTYESDGSPDKKSNRLAQTRVGSATEAYVHDLHGSMIRMPHLAEMATDFRDQLSFVQRQAVNDPATPVERTYYVYDATGERVRKVTARVTNHGLPNETRVRQRERRYLGASETYREFGSSGISIRLERLTLHVSDDRRRFALFETRTEGSDRSETQLIRCQFPNHLGSFSMEVEFQPAARVISYEEFHPYGTTAYQATNKDIKSVAKRYRFTGKERDEESGLNYHSARYLATWLGGWVSADPHGVEDGLNLYSYVNNNPKAKIDPTGLSEIIVVGGVRREPDPKEGHDTSAHHFYTAAARHAVKQVAANKKEKSRETVVILMYSPAYRVRAENDKKPLPDPTLLDQAKLFFGIGGYDREFHLDLMRSSAKKNGFDLRFFGSTPQLKKDISQISMDEPVSSLKYFGHSNDTHFLLNYGEAVPQRGASDSASEVFGIEELTSALPKDRLIPDATAISYGCNQGNAGGLMQQLHTTYGISTEGSVGKTYYMPIGQGKDTPSSEKGYRKYQ